MDIKKLMIRPDGKLIEIDDETEEYINNMSWQDWTGDDD